MRLRDRLADRRGGVAVMAAVFGGLICVSAAFAVDLGSMVLKGREVQGAADLSALAAAQALSEAEAAARATARANLAELSEARVQVGVYAPDARLKPAARFTPDAAEPNAARVVLSAPAPLFFGRWILGRDSVTVSKSATAALPGGPPSAMFSIGSRLASLDGGLANALLSGLLGSQASLTVMDYRALADARVNLLQFSDALAADLGVTAGDYDALLAHQVEVGRMLRVLEAVAGNDAQSALGKLTRVPTKATVKLEDLIGVEAEARESLRRRLDAEVSALDLLMAGLETANQDRQLALDVGARAGLADLDVILAIGERPNRSPWLTVTSHGEPIIRTVQTRLYLKATTAKALSGLTQVRLPVLIEAAASEGRLKRIDCGVSPAVTLEARPGVARARIGAIDESRLKNFKAELTVAPATLVSVLGLATVTGKADLEMADLTWSDVRFTSADIEADRVKTARARGFVNGLIVSLLQRLDLKADVGGGLLGLGLGDVAKTVGGLLTPLGPVLDGLVQPLLSLLGVGLGEADVQAHGVRCPGRDGVPILVG
jgi:uncharacterized membrane protein